MRPSVRLWAALFAALVGAGMLLIVVAEHTEDFWWGTSEPGADPFAYEVAIDTQAGTIQSNVPDAPEVSGDLTGLEFFVSGQSGFGQVDIKATDPAGTTVIEELVGPSQGFVYPDAMVGEPGFLAVRVDAPAEVPAPGGGIFFVIEAEVDLRNVAAQIVTGFSIEPYGNEGIAHLDSGRPDSCTRVELPLELTRGSVMRCTYRVELTGDPRHVEDSVATVHTIGGSWSSDPIEVAFVEPGAPQPEPPSPVESSFAEPGPTPSRGSLLTHMEGIYRITLVSRAGSPEFDFSMSAERSVSDASFGQLSPNRELAVALIGAAALALLSTRLPALWQRLSGLALATTGIAVPLAVVATEDDQWYWNTGTHLIWMVALALAGLGASVLAAPGELNLPEKRLPTAAYVGLGALGLITLGSVLLTAVLSPAYDGTWLGGDYLSYNGDYIVMGLHVYLFVLATPLVALTCGLFTMARHRGGDAGSTGAPPPSNPPRDRVASSSHELADRVTRSERQPLRSRP